MNRNVLWFVLVAALVVVAGCAKAPAPAPTPTPAPVSSDSGSAMGAAGIEFVNVPSEVEVGQKFSLSWKVSGADTTPHTALHYGFKSQAAVTELTTQTYPSAAPTGYLSGSTTDEFSTSLVFGDVVTMYVRAHAIVNGENVWTDEKVVKVVVPAKKVAATSDGSMG